MACQGFVRGFRGRCGNCGMAYDHPNHPDAALPSLVRTLSAEAQAAAVVAPAPAPLSSGGEEDVALARTESAKRRARAMRRATAGASSSVLCRTPSEADALRQMAILYRERDRLIATFTDLDEAGSCTVSKEEFSMALELLGVDATSGPVVELMAEYEVRRGSAAICINFVDLLRKIEPPLGGVRGGNVPGLPIAQPRSMPTQADAMPLRPATAAATPSAVPPMLLRLGLAEWKCAIAMARANGDPNEAGNLILEHGEKSDDWWLRQQREHSASPHVALHVAAEPTHAKDKLWTEMTSAERAAARCLGCSQATWDSPPCADEKRRSCTLQARLGRTQR